MTPVAGGFAVSTPDLPLVWTLNQVHLAGAIGYDAAVAVAEQHQGHLPFRHIVVEDAGDGALAAAFAAGGWVVDRVVVMALERPADRDVAADGVVELGEEEMLGLMRRWLAEDHPGESGEGFDQVGEYNRREGRLWHETRFGVRSDDGEAVAVAKLRREGPVAWVEDVYTVPEARGRGYARMLVTEATRRARAAEPEVTFILADDNDWPKELYRKVGFEPVGYMGTFHRHAGSDR